MKRTVFLLLSSVALLVGCANAPQPVAKSNSIAPWTPVNPAFRAFYGWNDRDGLWTVDWVTSQTGERIAVQTFASREANHAYKGTFFILHGYLEHGALRAPIAAKSLADNWLTVTVDLPGHGLSTGARGDIGDYSEYMKAFKAALESRNWPKPWRVMGHSMGCATLMLYIQAEGNPFELSIMEAPLVRTVNWDASMAGKDLVGWLIRSFPRSMGNLPPDQPYYKLLVSDPLYPNRMPIGWPNALERYVAGLKNWHVMDGPFLVVQGDNDRVVDAKYNIPFLENYLKDKEIVMIPNGNHILLRYKGPSGDLARAAVEKRWNAR